MTTHEFLASYDAKVMEYLLAVGYLLLFVPMWRYVHGATRTAEATVGVRAMAPTFAMPATAPSMARGWFHVPDGVALHAGHAWARLEAGGSDGETSLVTVGLDDFAQKLIDPEKVVLPKTGDHVMQGQPAFAVGDQVTTIPVRSPVEGTVVAVNSAAREQPASLRDPYGAGWLFKVRVPALANRAQLMLGDKAREFLERATDALAIQGHPELGLVLQDGGTPVHGLARALAGDDWAKLAKQAIDATPSTS